LWCACYLAVNAVTAGRAVLQPLLPGETRLPLVAAAYPFYASAYFEVFLPLFLARSRRAYAKAHLATGIGSLIAFAIFLAAPMPYPRPVLQLDGLWGTLLAFEW